jgi:hypothetical protein
MVGQERAQVLGDGIAQVRGGGPVAFGRADVNLPAVEVDVGGVECDGGAQADAGGEHEMEEHVVSAGFAAVSGCQRLEQPAGLVIG